MTSSRHGNSAASLRCSEITAEMTDPSIDLFKLSCDWRASDGDKETNTSRRRLRVASTWLITQTLLRQPHGRATGNCHDGVLGCRCVQQVSDDEYVTCGVCLQLIRWFINRYWSSENKSSQRHCEWRRLECSAVGLHCLRHATMAPHCGRVPSLTAWAASADGCMVTLLTSNIAPRIRWKFQHANWINCVLTSMYLNKVHTWIIAIERFARNTHKTLNVSITVTNLHKSPGNPETCRYQGSCR